MTLGFLLLDDMRRTRDEAERLEAEDRRRHLRAPRLPASADSSLSAWEAASSCATVPTSQAAEGDDEL